MNQQREVIYRQRRETLRGEDLKASFEDMIVEKAEEIADSYADKKIFPEEWEWREISEAVFKQFNFRIGKPDEDTLDGLNGDGLAELISGSALDIYRQKEEAIGEEDLRTLERIVMLQTVDNLWKDHLLSMDHLKEGIGLVGYGQQNPLLIYKKEGFEMFQDMIFRVKEETIGIMFRIQIAESEKVEDLRKQEEQNLVFSSGEEGLSKKPTQRDSQKVGRNAPCPCGSGKKYKKCCGR